MSDNYQNTVYNRLANFLIRFLPKSVKIGYSNAFLRTQLRASMEMSRAVSKDGEIDAGRVARAMQRNHGVIMPDALDDDSYVGVEDGESEDEF